MSPTTAYIIYSFYLHSFKFNFYALIWCIRVFLFMCSILFDIRPFQLWSLFNQLRIYNENTFFFSIIWLYGIMGMNWSAWFSPFEYCIIHDCFVCTPNVIHSEEKANKMKHIFNWIKPRCSRQLGTVFLIGITCTDMTRALEHLIYFHRIDITSWDILSVASRQIQFLLIVAGITKDSSIFVQSVTIDL